MPTVCSICADEVGANDAMTIDCGHTYHAKCIAQAFRHDPRCPNCRHLPEGIKRDDEESSESSSESSDDDDQGVSIPEALHIARLCRQDRRKAKQPDKRLDSMFKTLQTLERARKEIRTELAVITKELDEGYLNIDESTEGYHQRLTRTFERNNAAMIKRRQVLWDEERKTINKISASKKRIAIKFGHKP